MKLEFKHFISILALTIVVSRVFLMLEPLHSPVIWGIPMHHYMYGIVLIVIYFLVEHTAVLAVGLGLFIDELYPVYKLRLHAWPRTPKPIYESWQSFEAIVLAILMIIIVRLLHKHREEIAALISYGYDDKDR